MPSLTEEQKRVIDSIDRHVLVSAGAGSGKTFVLVERYIKVLSTFPEAGVADIIAVTYTRKAAEEMRSRLKVRLSAMLSEVSPEELPRWRQCLAELESARIGTIHSLCESLIKNYPAEAGIDPAFEILDDLERAELLSESIDSALQRLIEQPLEELAELLDYPIESLRNWLSEFLRSPLKFKESLSLFADTSIASMRSFAENLIKRDIERALDSFLEDRKFLREAAYLKETLWDEPESKLGLLQMEMLSYLKDILDTTLDDRVRFEAVRLLGSMESARSSGGTKGKELRAAMRLIRYAAKAVAAKHRLELTESDERSFRLLRSLLNLAGDALRTYENAKVQKQGLDFDDLIESCMLLVNGASNHALRQICRNLKAVLVDEFQDTNYTQARLLTALASRDASLFLIGDDKQSIYKFQGADVGVFNVCKRYISSLHENFSSEERTGLARTYGLPLLLGRGEELTLSFSFRSHPEIVNFVNHVFASLFESSADAGKRKLQDEFKSCFQALTPARTAAEDEPVRIEFLYTPDLEAELATVTRQDLERAESQMLALWIKEKVEQGTIIFDKELNQERSIKFSDFAVLLQANSDFADIEAALAKSGVPYVSIAGSGFLDRQEVLDLENLLKWLDCPQDSHALFAVLRSPLFGVSDDILHELKAGKANSLWQCLQQKSGEEGQELLQSARQALYELQSCAQSLTLPELLRKVVLKTCFDIVLLSADNGRQKSRNVFKFLALSAQHKHMSIAEFLRALRSMRELGVKNLTDAPLSAGNAVKIMTIHKSKGLEFAAVALPKLARGVHRKPGKLLFAKEFGIALDCTRELDEEKPSFFVAANNLSQKMDEEEKKRLLYVALTRARDYLALFITPRCKRGINFGKWLIEALGLPEPEGLVEELTMESGRGEKACRWKQRQISSISLTESLQLSDGEAERLLTEAASISKKVDSSLFSSVSSKTLTYAPVSWQSLLPVCPNKDEACLHPVIAGNYFHLLMNSLGPELQLPAENERRALLHNREVNILDPAEQELALRESERLLLTFKNSALYAMLKSSRRRLHEESYVVLSEDGAREFRPDLIFEDKDGGWHVVDFKTDHVDSKSIEKQVDTHAKQISAYAEDLELILGIKSRAWIYFAQLGRLEPVNLQKPLQLSLF